jgi:hypothetical protein
MSVSIRVTMTRPNTSTVWPFDIWSSITAENFLFLEANSVESWIKGNEDTDTNIIVDHYFADDAVFASFKTTAQQHIPLWKNSSNLAETVDYEADNSITFTVTEVSNPVHTEYTKITDTRAASRGL